MVMGVVSLSALGLVSCQWSFSLLWLDYYSNYYTVNIG